MNKITSRLLVFFIGLPLVLCIVFLNFQYHLAIHLAIGIVSVLAANEMYNMISKKSYLFSKAVVLTCTGLLPYITYVLILFNLPTELTIWGFVLESIFLMILTLKNKTFENLVFKISNSLFIIFYCGFLPTFISRMTFLPNSRYWIGLFLIFVFMCDSCAWFFGILFGKNNKGFIPASPNKSIVGFIGGIIGSIFFGLLFKYIFNSIITISYLNIVILGLITSFSGIIGDLIESVFKRALECKDSGNIIPGRGGMLDSIDSIVISAPVYYAGLYFIAGII